jgi:hypothetical protein
MRMTASWSGSTDPTAYKSVARRCDQWRAPLGSSSIDRQAPSGARSYAKSPIAVHCRCACSGVKALRNTSTARRQAAKLCLRFGPLTPSARSANLITGDGTKNGFPAPNKELPTNQKTPLDRKSPIQVRIHLPPAESPSLSRIHFRRPRTPAFRPGVRGWLGERVGRDAQGVSISRQPAAISLSGHIPVPQRR